MRTLFVLLHALILLLNSSITYGQKATNGADTVEGFINKKIEVITNTTQSAAVTYQHDVIELNEPPLSVVCDRTKGDKLKFMKDLDGYLFFLSVNELFVIKVNQTAKLFFVGTLLDIQEEDPVQSVQIEKWQNLYMVVIQQSSKLKVYLIALDETQNPEIHHLHQMNFASSSEKFRIFRKGEDVLLVIYQIQEQALNKLKFYKWQNSFFVLESTDTTDLPNKGDLFVYNESPDETLLISLGYGNGSETSHITAFKYDEESNKWLKRQKMHFKKDYIEPYIINGSLYLIGCASDSFCALYYWKDNAFHRHLKLSNNVFELIKSIYSRHNIIIIENFQNKLSFYSSNNITSSDPSLQISKYPGMGQYGVYKSPKNELYFMEAKFNETSMLISFHEISINRNIYDRMRASNKKIDPIECILELKMSLKNRVPVVKASEKSALTLSSKNGSFEINNKRFLNVNYVRLQNSKVGTLKMPYNITVQSKDLVQQSISTNIELSRLNRTLRSSSQLKFRTNEEESKDIGLESINVKNLIYSGKQPVFEDILRKSQSTLNLNGQFKLTDLSANKLVVVSNAINHIQLDKLLNATKVQKISGKKTVQSMRANELMVKELLNNVPVKFLKGNDDVEETEDMAFIGDINASHLNVKVLNGFNVSSLMSQLCLENSRTVVNGDLYIRNALNVKHLFANHIKSIPINNFLTTATDQTIESDVFISKFHANTITAKLVNNEDISTNFALINEENQIEVPTNFMKINVIENLNIQDIKPEDESTSKELVEMLRRHVIGTDTSDLTQIYNKKVVIRGSLTLKNVDTFSPKTKIIVNNMQVPQNISSNFWMKNLMQHVQVPNFKIHNEQVTLSSGLVTRFLNNHPVDNFLRLNTDQPQGPINVRFKSAIVKKNVRTFERNFPSMLYRMSQLAIHRDSSRAEISSPIEFRNQLIVKNLQAHLLNNAATGTFVHKNLHHVLFDAVKAIDSVEVNNLEVDRTLVVENYNNINLEKFIQEIIRIDRPFKIERLKMHNFTAASLTIRELENHNFNEMIKNLKEELNFDSDSKKGKRSIHIHGDAEFKSNIFIDFLNDDVMQFNEFMEYLVMKNDRNREIGGKKIFKKDLTIKSSLLVPKINNHMVHRLLNESLSRVGDQEFKGNHLFITNLKVQELHANNLNNVSWHHLVDKKRLHLPLLVNLEVNEIDSDKLYTRSASLDINDMLKSIQFPVRTRWNYITSTGETKLVHGGDTLLDKLIKYGVLKNVRQVIRGNVRVMNAADFYMKKVVKPDSLVNSQYAYNISVWNEDGVKNNSALEVITGMKQIFKNYRFDANNLIIESQCYFDSAIINNIDVREFNRSIHRNENFLNSEKTFENVFVNELSIESGLLNGVDPKHIVYISNTGKQLPMLNLTSLEVGNMQISTFNGYSFEYMMDKRMKRHGVVEQDVQHTIVFNSILFEQDVKLTSINNVFIDDAVFEATDEYQQIKGHKVINGSLIFKNRVEVASINEKDVSDLHKSTVFLNTDYRSNGPLQLPEIELRNGMQVNRNINGQSVNELLSSDAHSPKLKDLVSLIGDVRKKISVIDHQKAIKRENRRMLYVDIDESIDFQYRTPKARDSSSENDEEKCSVSNELDFKPYSKGVVVSKRSDSEMTVDLKSVHLRVSPNIICKENTVSTRVIGVLWKYAYDNQHTFFQNFSYPDMIFTDVKFLETEGGGVHMIQVLYNEKSRKSVVAFLYLDKVNHEWLEPQLPLNDFYEVAKIGIVEAFDKENYLVVSTYNSNVEGDKIMIYRLDRAKNIFVQSQTPFVGGNFDIVLSINVKPKSRAMRLRTFLLFSRTNGREIKIYRMKDGSKEFAFQRMIDDFRDNIVEVLILYINDMPFFIVSQQSGLFCMYEWRGIESWQSKYCGRFENIRQMKSFEYLNRQHLFLASIAQKSEPSLNALAIYRQGDFF